MKPEIQYAITVDQSTQWFTTLVKVEKDFSDYEPLYHIVEDADLSPRIENEFLSNIFERPYMTLSLIDRNTGSQNYAVWWISERDYKIVQEMIKLYPIVCRYKTLGELQK